MSWWSVGLTDSTAGSLFLVFEKLLISGAYAFNMLLLKKSFGFVLRSCIFVCSLPRFMALHLSFLF